MVIEHFQLKVVFVRSLLFLYETLFDLLRLSIESIVIILIIIALMTVILFFQNLLTVEGSALIVVCQRQVNFA